MAAYGQRYEMVRDSRAIFSELCSRMTELIADSLPEREWIDRAWIVALAEAFASHYFAALHAYDEGRIEPGAWAEAFEFMARPRISVLGALIAGMACHIMHDMPLGLAETEFRDRPDRIHDYQLMNEVLCDAIDGLFEMVTKRYNPILHWLERVGKRSDEDLMVGYGIRIARRAAWYDACRLQAPASRAEALGALEENTIAFMRLVLRPPFWSGRALVKFVRWITSLGRVWPKPLVPVAVAPPQSEPHRDHYFRVGAGDWRGTFRFRITNLPAFAHAPMKWKSRILALGLALVGRARIDAKVRSFPDQGSRGVAHSTIRLSRFGITFLRLHELHNLLPDGSSVFIEAIERIGPPGFSIESRQRYATAVTPSSRTLCFTPVFCRQWQTAGTCDETGITATWQTTWARAEEKAVRARERS